jgi:replicative DNA helicase
MDDLEQPSERRSRRRQRMEVADPSKVDRLPPHSIEAEQGTLGCLMLEPGRGMAECYLKFKKAGSEAFYDLRHRTIFGVMAEMYDKREMIDLITLSQKLKDRQQLEAVGGMAYLSSLPDAVPSAANLEYYLNIVWDKYKARKLLQTCTDIVGKVYEHEGEIDALINEAETQILKVNDGQFASMLPAPDLVRQAIEILDRASKTDGPIGVPTGFTKLDRMIGGMEPEDMIVLAARPSVGKTTLLLNMADHIAVVTKEPVGVFSVEMAANRLMLRMLCARAKVNWKQLNDGMASERDFPRLTSAASALSKAPIHIDETAGLLTNEFRAKARRMVELYGVKVIMVDYMQIMHSSKPRTKRCDEVSDISSTIKSAAKELKIPVLALSQLDRGLDKEKYKKPRLSDLRESGSIEQDADKILFLYETEQKNKDPRFDEECLSVGCVVAKQRNGETGEIPFNFFKQYTRYEEAYERPSEGMVENALFGRGTQAPAQETFVDFSQHGPIQEEEPPYFNPDP